ncbi:uncharacterized protein N7446_010160 [Penicillium canescens]|uniref:uncharacterized protein n=1 Tax=Penicillium canescens TaxID=5083 RepID=UPI0026DEF8C7|nr:uncharacterized protein N7446_010160 [Penicillium canescens]KAJ6054148.1 hypothetical protein N7446_010160 [Penicillium canescens]
MAPTHLSFHSIQPGPCKDSLVVTHLTTNLPACGLSTAERTGSPVLHTLWSYVLILALKRII